MIHLWGDLTAQTVGTFGYEGKMGVFGIGNEVFSDAGQGLLPHFKVDGFLSRGL